MDKALHFHYLANGTKENQEKDIPIHATVWKTRTIRRKTAEGPHLKRTGYLPA
jgi:hypothetical protein